MQNVTFHSTLATVLLHATTDKGDLIQIRSTINLVKPLGGLCGAEFASFWNKSSPVHQKGELSPSLQDQNTCQYFLTQGEETKEIEGQSRAGPLLFGAAILQAGPTSAGSPVEKIIVQGPKLAAQRETCPAHLGLIQSGLQGLDQMNPNLSILGQPNEPNIGLSGEQGACHVEGLAAL